MTDITLTSGKNASMKTLVERLNAASRAYYQEDREIMSDAEYDALYDKLVELEAQTGIQLATSPTRKVGYEVVSSLVKVAHDITMLSLDKTKDIIALTEFLGEHKGILLWKLDGLSIVLRYENGQLRQALTRGNGQIGEDVTHNAKVFANLPLTVPYRGSFSVKGEALISFADFEAINSTFGQDDIKYKNPRNLCSGTVRQLNSEVSSGRRVLFYAFGVANVNADFENIPTNDNSGDDNERLLKSDQLKWLTELGFDVTTYEHVTQEDLPQAVERFKSQIQSLPFATDGLVLTYDNIAYSKSLGTTSKFPRDSLAFKWADDISKTTLLSIEWNPSRTGLINPVAIFEPVEIEGSVVSRASLHNVSILRALKLGIGDCITVYKANMIIPQISENLTCSNTIDIPTHCPICSTETEITTQSSDSEVLICTNPNCSAKLMQSLVHFVSRDGLNIEGMSEQTLEKLVSNGLVCCYSDIFNLEQHQAAILSLEGFGQRLYDKLQASIVKSKDIALPNFIYALGIRHVGLSNAKLLCTHFDHDIYKIADACKDPDYLEILAEVKGFGEAISHALRDYFISNMDMVVDILTHLSIRKTPMVFANQPLSGQIFVITGDLNHYPNRKTLQNYIESQGGRIASSVTAKTSFLINNDAASNSSKNKKAAQLGVSVITEDEFIAQFGQ